MKTLRLSVLLMLLGAFFSACIADDGSHAIQKDEIESAIRLEAADQQAMSSADLAQIIENAGAKSIALADAWAEIRPEYWVSDVLGNGLFESFLWPAANLASAKQGIPRRSDRALAISSADATDLLYAILAFREMLQRMDPHVWTVLVDRSSKGGTLLDLCLMMQITWGHSLRVLPGDAVPASSRESANTPLPQPLPATEWRLPHGAPDQWMALATGSNAVFRLLAIKGLDLWAGSNELPSLLRTALNDPYLSIREEAVSRLDRLAPEMQAQLLDEYVQRKKPWVPITEAEREGEKWMNDRIAEKLKMLHVTSRPSSQSEQ